jgi:PAS domain S-box-containing protein
MATIDQPLAGLRILIVEDDARIAGAMRDRLTVAGCEVIDSVDSGQRAIDAATLGRPDLVLMDVGLKGDMDGVRAAELIYERLEIPVVFLTGDADHATLQRAMATGAFGYVLKPFHAHNLLAAIEVGVHRFRLEQRLRKSELTHETILGSISVGVIATDTQSRIRLMNPVAEYLTGWSLWDAQGQPLEAVLQLANSAGQPSQPGIVARVMAARAALRFDGSDFLLARGGDRVPIDGGAEPIVDRLGRLVGATVTIRDISAAKRAELELRTVAEQLRAIVDTAADGVLLLDQAGAVLMFNPASVRLFGYKADEVLGHNVGLLLPSPLEPDAPGEVPEAQPPARPPLFSAGGAGFCRRQDGSVFPVEVSMGEAAFDGRSVYVAVVHDVSSRKELEAALLDAIGHEQRRLGRDLHDGLGQDLTGMTLLVAALSRDARNANLPNVAELEKLGRIAKHSIETCRSIARGLSPIDEAQGGLIEGLRDLILRLGELPGTKIHFVAPQATRLGLTPSAADHLYRIAQEALSNALKHSDAHAIDVVVDVKPQWVRLEICDDGIGFGHAAADELGLGLKTMRYRANMIGAQLSITERQPSGTCVVCRCPQAA